MIVNLIKAKSVRAYAYRHASSIGSFEEWIDKVNNADWDRPEDMRRTFASVDYLGGGSSWVVFDIGGNQYRIICSYYFNPEIETATLFVKWIGTHAQYDKLCNRNKQYSVDEF